VTELDIFTFLEKMFLSTTFIFQRPIDSLHLHAHTQAVPIMLPTVALNDVDAADSPYAMTLSVRARFGKLELAAPYDLARAENTDPLPSVGYAVCVGGCGCRCQSMHPQLK
jgi:hypothetical protein